MNILNKMDRKDWIFIIGYVALVLTAAMVLDLGLNLVNGSYIVIPGVILGGPILRNRLLAKK